MNAKEKNKKTSGQIRQRFFYIMLALFFFFNITATVILFSRKNYPDNTETSPPKYIFLFIGDGFGYAQMRLGAQYKSITTQGMNGNEDGKSLTMLDFGVTGMAFTDNATSVIGESAASATAIASGIKTYNGYLNYDTEGNKTETIAEKLKKQTNYKIGVISSVNINHATPAAFYAHQDSRYNQGSIFLELLDSGFDFFGGGSILEVASGEEQSGKTLAELLSEKKYSLIHDINDVTKLENSDDKIIFIPSKLDAYGTLPYTIDKIPDAVTLADLTEKCTQLLYNDDGFFIMVEGGKIDWSGHANDAATMAHEVIAFDDAIKKAVDFYAEHPEETLIIVTGDHETGGLSLGYAATYTYSYLSYLERQKISYSEFSQKVYSYRKNQIPFEDILPDIEQFFGISQEYNGLDSYYLTAEDMQKLRDSYEHSLVEPSMRYFTMTEYVSYGFYDPLTTTITSIINKKSGLTWGTFSHTFGAVPVLATGNGADLFGGAYHNSEIFHKLKNLLNLD